MAGKKWTGVGKYILAVLLAVTVATAPNLHYISQVSAADISASEQEKEDLEKKNEELTQQLEQARQNTEDKRAHK